MKREFLNYRYYVLFVLFSTAMLFVFGEEQDEAMGDWFFHFIFDKAIGFGAGYAAFRLSEYWQKAGKLPWFDKMDEEAETEDLWD